MEKKSRREHLCYLPMDSCGHNFQEKKRSLHQSSETAAAETAETAETTETAETAETAETVLPQGPLHRERLVELLWIHQVPHHFRIVDE